MDLCLICENGNHWKIAIWSMVVWFCLNADTHTQTSSVGEGWFQNPILHRWCIYKQWEQQNDVSARFLMILFMVFVLSYERCNNNSLFLSLLLSFWRRHSFTHRHIYLQFSSFDLAISHKFRTMWLIHTLTNCTKWHIQRHRRRRRKPKPHMLHKYLNAAQASAAR